MSKVLRPIDVSALLVFWLIAGGAPDAQTPKLSELAARAHAAMAEERFDAAARLYATLAEARPREAWLHMNLGTAYAMAGRPQQARAPLERAIELDPSLLGAQLFLGMVYLDLGQPKRAVDPLRTVLAVEASNVMARQALGEALVELRRYEEAATELAQVTRALPESAHAWAALGRSYDGAAQQAAQQASAALRTGGAQGAATTRTDTDRERSHQRAVAFSHLADEAFRRLEELPASVELHVVKAELYRARGGPRDAVRELRAAAKLAPNDPAIARDLAAALYLARNYDEARPIVERLLKADPNDPNRPDLQILYGRILLDTQQVDEALTYLEAAIRAAPANAEGQAALGRALMLKGDARAAVPHLKAALVADEDGSLHYQLAQAYRQTGQPALARSTLETYKKLQAQARRGIR
ncbi:MAG: tetratricopeptide repeat protein [Luteitalea sp.]|nr:tetratricopeptide repeat protein [Luteitalea sp.]